MFASQSSDEEENFDLEDPRGTDESAKRPVLWVTPTSFFGHRQYRTSRRPYYESEGSDAKHYQRILRWYKQYFEGGQASLLIPVGALRAIRRIVAWSGGRAVSSTRMPSNTVATHETTPFT